ncbi:hypothetical protein IRT45_25235 [Nocardia sp. BSTN01]|uniref:hypothetical protein n=1 Tax=Nocardia sp. BSTN01 TaxID=2783665 RepID=UPI00188E6779|nr:hypothetical protein [Nocardia sp. BSTN01]MBF5000450.1 hypothetical protein [Nocardia sp. BSTN01]
MTRTNCRKSEQFRKLGTAVQTHLPSPLDERNLDGGLMTRNIHDLQRFRVIDKITSDEVSAATCVFEGRKPGARNGEAQQLVRNLDTRVLSSSVPLDHDALLIVGLPQPGRPAIAATAADESYSHVRSNHS